MINSINTVIGFVKEHKVLILIIISLIIALYVNFIYGVEYQKNTDTEDKHYINELYKSDDRIYNNYLSDEEKKMYDFLVEQAKEYKSNITIDLNDFNCPNYDFCGSLVSSASQAILIDHPEFLNFANYGWHYDQTIDEFNVKLYYSYRLRVKDTIGKIIIEKAISNIVNETKNMTDKEKIIYVYEWIGKNNIYDSTFTYDSKNQSPYNVFVKHNAVCAGFAKSSQLILKNIGIESYIAYGNAGSLTVDHMWNIVKYNNKYYYFDSTAATSYTRNQPISYNGLNQEFMNSYKLHNSNWYPKIETSNMFDIS